MFKLISSKRGMGVNQIFIFIISALVFSLIMIFGYRTIGQFIESGEKVEYAQFQNDLENSIKKIYTEYGAIRIETYYLPTKYSKICFVDLGYLPNEQEIQSLCDEDEKACSAWEFLESLPKDADRYNHFDENVFLTPASSTPIKVYRISIGANNTEGYEIQRGYLCLKMHNGAFNLVLEGKGDHTELS